MWYGILDVMIDQGDVEAASAWLDQMPTLRNPELSKPMVDLERAWVATKATDSPEARAKFDRLFDAYLSNPVHGTGRAIYMASALGNGDLAVELLRAAIDADGRTNLGRLWLPGMASVRLHPEFADVADSLLLTDYWHAVEWPDSCGPTEDGRITCFR